MDLVIPYSVRTIYGDFPAGVKLGVESWLAEFLINNHDASEYRGFPINYLDTEYASKLYAAGRTAQRPRLSGVQQVWNSPAFAAGTAVTIQNQVPAMAPFKGLRVIHKNPTATPATLHDCRVGSPAADADNGAALAWSQATFSGSASPSLPAATGAEPNMTYTYVRSGYIALKSANDALPLAVIRSRFEASGCALNPAAGYLTAFNSVSGIGRFLSGFSLGAGVVSDTTGIAMSEGQLICPAAMEFYYDLPTVSVLWAGGSTLWGQGSEGYANGFMFRACRALTNGRRVVSPINTAFPGQTGAVSHLSAMPALLDVVKPGIVVLLPGSGNDTDLSEAGFSLMRGRFAAALDSAWRAGAAIMAVTLAPSSALNATQDALRRVQNEWVLSLGIEVADIASVLENPANRAQLLPEYDSGDGTHFSIAGHAACGLVVQTSLSRLFGL